LPFDSSHMHGWRNMLTGMEIGEVPKMAAYEGRIRPQIGWSQGVGSGERRTREERACRVTLTRGLGWVHYAR
jgi:hypothetical protein